ncbi:MAG: M48 family metallopeptidase [Polyangiaceae bacterium]
MAEVGALSFKSFVDARNRTLPGGGQDGGRGYAYVDDRTTATIIDTAQPVRVAVEAAVRLFKAFGTSNLLGSAVKVGPNQFPRVYRLVQQCAETLGIATPTVFVVNSPVMNAGALGTDQDAFIMVHSALIDRFSDEELLSVIGHECGHIHNRHVVYLTALHYLTRIASIFSQAVTLPAQIPLLSYQRRAEITCDRAGLLCCKNLEVSTRTITKLALGSSKLFNELNLEAFLDQFEEGKDSLASLGEYGASHPYLPKRVLALRKFAASALYRQHAGLGQDGLTMQEVDNQVFDLIRVVR